MSARWRRTQRHCLREEAEPEERPEHVTRLFLSHLTDIVVDIIVKFFDFAFFFFLSLKYMFYLVLSIIVFEYNSYTKCRHELLRKIENF